MSDDFTIFDKDDPDRIYMRDHPDKTYGIWKCHTGSGFDVNKGDWLKNSAGGTYEFGTMLSTQTVIDAMMAANELDPQYSYLVRRIR